MIDEPDPVVKAVALLKGSETVSDHERRAKQLYEAFGMLNTYLKETPDSEHREYIENCKRSYMRTHLKRLSELDEPDEMTWFHNVLLFVNAEREVVEVLDELPELKPWHNRFEQSCREWFQNAVLRLQKQGKI
jgi:hypothetical protein